MLRAIANDRAALELHPGPVRILVQSIQEDDDGRRYARVAVADGDAELLLHQVRSGETFPAGGRTLLVEDMCDDGHAASIRLSEIRG